MSASPIRARRSFIFCPGSRPDMFPKALASGADMVCVDLEDAIAPKDKAAARDQTLALFAAEAAEDGIERLVRVNCLRTRDGIEDLAAILAADRAPPALMLPKVKWPDEIRALDELLDENASPIRLHVIVETNAALEACHEIARASGRIEALFFGGVDMAAELRCDTSWEALSHARASVVHAAAGAGLDVIDVPHLDLDDLDGMRAEAEAAKRMGYVGKASIHPKQIAILNEVFSPSAEEIAYARKVIDAFASADSGLVVVDGKLIEKPVLRTVNRILATAERSGAAGA
jgi:citrate lyase beta subunit